MFDNKKH